MRDEGEVGLQRVARGKVVAGTGAEREAQAVSLDVVGEGTRNLDFDAGVGPPRRRGHNDLSIDQLIAVDVLPRPLLDPAAELLLRKTLVGTERGGDHDAHTIARWVGGWEAENS